MCSRIEHLSTPVPGEGVRSWEAPVVEAQSRRVPVGTAAIRALRTSVTTSKLCEPHAVARTRPWAAVFQRIPLHRPCWVGLHGDGWTGTDSSGKARMPPRNGAEERAAIGRGRSVHKVADENVVDELDVAVQGVRRPVPAPPMVARCCVLHAACRRMPLRVAAACMPACTWFESRPEEVLATRIASTALAPSATRTRWPTARSAT